MRTLHNMTTTNRLVQRRPRSGGTTSARQAFQCRVGALISATAQAFNANVEPERDDRDDEDLEDAADAELAEDFAEAWRIAKACDAGVLQPPVELARRAA